MFICHNHTESCSNYLNDTWTHLLFHWPALPWPVHWIIALGRKGLLTLVTGIRKHVWEVMSFHMVSCVVAGSVGVFVTKCAVKSVVSWVLPYKLKQFTWVLEFIAWYKTKISIINLFTLACGLYVYAYEEQLLKVNLFHSGHSCKQMNLGNACTLHDS